MRSLTLVAVVVAAVATALAASAALGLVRARRRYERAVETAATAFQAHARALSQLLVEGHARLEQARTAGVSELELVLELDALLGRAVSEAATNAGAAAAALRVDGPGAESVVASFGHDEADALLERVPVPPDAQPFRALLVSWADGSGPDAGAGLAYRCALAVPIVEDVQRSGVLVACATEPDAFRTEHVDALERIARDLSHALPNVRRVALAERRLVRAGG